MNKKIDRGISILVLVTSAFASSAWAGLASVTKAFGPSTIPVGSTSTLTITIEHGSGNSDNIAFTDNYPANLRNAPTPNVSTTCKGATVTAVAGGASLRLSGLKLAGKKDCTVSVSVTSTVAGSYLNSTGVVTSDSGSVGPASATLTVTAAAPTVAKSFGPGSIAVNGTSTLTITLTNPNAVAITGAAFVDAYPANVENAVTPALTNTCGGTAAAAAGGTSLGLSGGTVPAGGSCSLSVQVTGTAAGSYLNSTGPVTTANVGTGTAATATLTVAGSSAAPSGFNAFDVGTPAGSVSGVIRTKIAAAPFSLAVVALKSGGTAVETAFAGDVKLELVDASTGAGCGAYGLIRPLGALSFGAGDLGRKTLPGISEANAWPNARIRMTHPATGVPTLVACSGDNFAIRPASLSVAVSDTDWQTAGTTRTLANMNAAGGFVHKAGQPFTLRATARDASNNVTPNYAGQPTLKTLACMLPAPTCTNGNLTFRGWSGSGTASTSATYSEAGSFNLTLEDQTFANVDHADSTLLERTIPQAAALAVGRFVPDHFELTPGIIPSFRTFNETPANCPVRSFTYIGQAFGYAVTPTATILAKGQGNNTLANYRGSLWKIGGAIAPVVVKDCSTDPNTCVFATNWSAAGASSEVIETYTYVLAPASTPNWDDAGSIPAAANVNTSTGLISFAASDTLAFKRGNAAPQAPFTAGITNTITVKDLSEAGNCGAANCDITTATPAQFADIGFDGVTPGNEFRFGQLVLSNAHGSELLALPVPIETRYWNGVGFVLNADDHCTQLSAADVSLGNWQRDLNSPETTVTLAGRFNAGRGNLRLSRPGAGNTGSVDLTVQLDAAAQNWLQGRWSGAVYNQNPTARASFGLYRGSKPLIYLREMY